MGQLFCNNSSLDVIKMLLDECNDKNVKISLGTTVKNIEKTEEGFVINTENKNLKCSSLVIASGGLSIPKIGATNFGYNVAKQFGIPITNLKPGLVPLTFQEDLLNYCRALTGISLKAEVFCNSKSFREGFLFTHRGLSGPAILQISSYFNDGDKITVDLSPDVKIKQLIEERRKSKPKQNLGKIISEILPKRLSLSILAENNFFNCRIADLKKQEILIIANRINKWILSPDGTEGYRTAEVTLGGVDTKFLSSKTMEVKSLPGLYFIGEVLDVTGQLGGHNFQWAWSSGWAAGQVV